MAIIIVPAQRYYDSSNMISIDRISEYEVLPRGKRSVFI